MPAAEAKLPPRLVVAEVVIGTDYLKTFFASIRKLFGGEMRSLETLMERARREAISRILETARAEGYNAICNLRLESADISGISNQKANFMVAVIGTATAYQSSVPVK